MGSGEQGAGNGLELAMFDFDAQLELWRKSAADAIGQGSGELLDELEAHLRDEFDHQMELGRPAQEAWETAARKLGSPARIAAERDGRPRAAWIPAWVAAGSFAIFLVFLIAVVTRGFQAGRMRPLLAAHVMLVTAGYAAVLTTGFLSICSILARATTGWTERQDVALRYVGLRLAIVAWASTLPGVVLGAWWAHDNLGRWWDWDAKEIGGLCVLAWAGVLIQCYGMKQSTAQTRMLGGLIGNMIVALAWFGPYLVGSGLRSYGMPGSRMGLGGFLLSQMLLVYVLLSPAGVFHFGRAGAGKTA